MPAERTVACGNRSRSSAAAAATSANAAFGSAPSGATAISPASRSPAHAGDVFGEPEQALPGHAAALRVTVDAVLQQNR